MAGVPPLFCHQLSSVQVLYRVILHNVFLAVSQLHKACATDDHSVKQSSAKFLLAFSLHPDGLSQPICWKLGIAPSTRGHLTGSSAG